MMSDYEEAVEIDKLDSEDCDRCGGGHDGKLLVCSEIGCETAIHKDCASSPHLGEFHCGNCALARSQARTEKLKRKALDRAVGPVSEGDSGRRMLKCGGFTTVVVRKIEDDEGTEKRKRKCIKIESSDSGNELVAVTVEAIVPEKTASVALRVVPSPSGKLSSEAREIPESNQSQSEENAAASFYGTRKLPDWKPREEVDAYFKPRKAPDSNQRKEVATSSAETNKTSASTNENLSGPLRECEENGGKSREEEQMQRGTEVPADAMVPESKEDLVDPFRRRRFNWTAEELEFLKEKAPTFRKNQNIAWKKLLDAGKDVFHPIRTAENLKDKYKSIQDKNNGGGSICYSAEGKGVNGGEIQDESVQVEENEHMDTDTEQRKCVEDETNGDAHEGVEVPETNGDAHEGVEVPPSGKSSSHPTGALKENGEKPNGKSTASYSESREISESTRTFSGDLDQNKAVTTYSKARKTPEPKQHEEVKASSAKSSETPESASKNLSAVMLVSEENEDKIREEEQIQTGAEVPEDASLREPGQITELASENLEDLLSRRRRVNWTAEEVDFLKKKVSTYAVKVKTNIPWKKILEEGKDVFHPTRTPENLKDKCKTICKKTLLNNNQS